MNKINSIYIFFNSARGFKVLEYLQKKNYPIKKIYLSKKNCDNKIILKLKKKNIKFKTIKSLKDNIIKKELSRDYDLGIIAGFPLIFSKLYINKPKYGFINCHGGKIPEYGGGSPLNWQIINGEKKFYISVLKVSENLDSGPIITSKGFKLKSNYRIEDLHKISNKNFPVLVEKALKKLNQIKNLKKNSKTKIWPQRKIIDSYLHFYNKDAIEILNQIRGSKKPYQSFFLNKKRKFVVIEKANLSKKSFKRHNIKI